MRQYNSIHYHTWYAKNKHKKQVSCRDWYQKNAIAKSQYNMLYHSLYPSDNSTRTSEMVKAHNFVQQHPEILGSKCECCDAPINLCAHHVDYSYPTIIVTLCKGCHNNIHKESKINVS